MEAKEDNSPTKKKATRMELFQNVSSRLKNILKGSPVKNQQNN